MSDALLFVGLMLVVLLCYMALQLRGKGWRAYFSMSALTGCRQA